MGRDERGEDVKRKIKEFETKDAKHKVTFRLLGPFLVIGTVMEDIKMGELIMVDMKKGWVVKAREEEI